MSLAVSGSDLYVGGRFSSVEGIPANNIAKWDGSSWSALGSGMTGGNADFGTAVQVLAVVGSDVYAGGNFSSAGGSPANNIARWDGTTWSALGGGVVVPAEGGVNAVALWGGNLYVGGYFSSAGGISANNIAKWDGTNWSALGSGISADSGGVYALAVSGNDLFVGGNFWTAGGKASPFLARAYLPALPSLAVFRSGKNAIISWPSAQTEGFSLEQAETLAVPATWVPNSLSVADDGTKKSVTVPATNSAQRFRLRRP
jgi:hypothetical protein